MNARQPTRGNGYKKEIWFSICSMHYQHEPTCHLCNTGHWINVRKHALTSYLHDNYYEKWFKWANYNKQGNRKGLNLQEYESI